MVHHYLCDMCRKRRSFVRGWWLLLAGRLWPLGTAGQVINCSVNTSPDSHSFPVPAILLVNCSSVTRTTNEICDYTPWHGMRHRSTEFSTELTPKYHHFCAIHNFFCCKRSKLQLKHAAYRMSKHINCLLPQQQSSTVILASSYCSYTKGTRGTKPVWFNCH